MEILTSLISFIIHIDKHLGEIIIIYGALSYLILFIIVFAETGLVFTPFLPGDSLLFAAGAFAALGSFNIVILLLILTVAAILGDTVNYWIGHHFGKKIIAHPKIPINQEHIDKTEAFYKKYGGKTIVIARFVPIVRTFAPFVAGTGKMDYNLFIKFNIFGGLIWVLIFTLLGYFFGNMPIVKNNFSLVVFVIIFMSIIPFITEIIQAIRRKKKDKN